MKTVRALERGLAALAAVAQHESGLGPSRVAEIIGTDKATAARMITTLVEAGYLAPFGDDGRYRVTPKVLSFGQLYLAKNSMVAVAQRHMIGLRDEFDETVHLATRLRHDVVYVGKLETRRSIRLATYVGQTMPLYSTGLGKAMLSALPADQREALVHELDLTRKTTETLGESDALLADLAAAADRGYAIDRGENEENVVCAAAAIMTAHGETVGAISVAGPAFRILDRIEVIGPRVSAAAQAIAGELDALHGGVLASPVT